MPNPPQPFLEFELKYLMGIDAVDSQHKQIVDLLNKLHESIITKKPGELHLELLAHFLHLMKIHFVTEEQVMRARSYPGYLRHKTAHEGLARHLMEYRGQIAKRERALTIEYAELMKLWLIDHFAEFDLGYVKFLSRENPTTEIGPSAGGEH